MFTNRSHSCSGMGPILWGPICTIPASSVWVKIRIILVILFPMLSFIPYFSPLISIQFLSLSPSRLIRLVFRLIAWLKLAVWMHRFLRITIRMGVASFLILWLFLRSNRCRSTIVLRVVTLKLSLVRTSTGDSPTCFRSCRTNRIVDTCPCPQQCCYSSH